jgi:hypothetical protein
VDGHDLIELGFEPGPPLGTALRELLHEVVEDPRRNTREQLLARAADLRPDDGSARRGAEAREA